MSQSVQIVSASAKHHAANSGAEEMQQDRDVKEEEKQRANMQF